jgi:hypothetical protein
LVLDPTGEAELSFFHSSIQSNSAPPFVKLYVVGLVVIIRSNQGHYERRLLLLLLASSSLGQALPFHKGVTYHHTNMRTKFFLFIFQGGISLLLLLLLLLLKI